VARYGDCLLAQVLQSVACNTVHDVEARVARWLLAMHDRIGNDRLLVTQEIIAAMLGLQRAFVIRAVAALEQSGAIHHGRGLIAIVDRLKLENQACECYGQVRRHFERLLPGVYPTVTS
jgi:hypothetical protein